MPKQLGIVGTALAVGSGFLRAGSSKRRADEVNDAQQKQNRMEKQIRDEQAVRERRRQVRTSRIAASQSEAMGLATGSSQSSGATTAQSAISGDYAENIGSINTGLAEGNLNYLAATETLNAGQPTFFETFNEVISPSINNNVANINEYFS